MPARKGPLWWSARRGVAVGLAFVVGCTGSAGPQGNPGPNVGEASARGRTPAPEASDPPSPRRPDPPPAAGNAAALEGAEWIVAELNGEALLDGSRISLEFLGGQVSGNASCNRYVADWDQPAPDRIRIGAARATLRACAPALMDQERLFMDLLGRFESVRIDGENELVLRTAGGEELRATRS